MKSMLTVLCLTGLATLAQADWRLNQADSSFNFASIKKNDAYETHTFNRYEGSISDSGTALLKLDLSSVNTGIEIRDERMKTMLFDSVKFPSAEYHLQVDPASLAALEPGERLQMDVEGSLSLFGMEIKQPASLNIFKLTDHRILVSTAKPVAINAADYGLGEGIEALRKIANLPVISQTVPVNFSLVFDQQN